MKYLVVIDTQDFRNEFGPLSFEVLYRLAKVIATLQSEGPYCWGIKRPILTSLEDDQTLLELIRKAMKE